jgi:glycosyltransferase 2 family protein
MASRWRLPLLLLLWLVLAVTGVTLAVRFSGVPVRELGRLLVLPVPTAILLALLCAGLYASDAVRYRLLGAAVGTPVGWRTALETSIANYFFGWVTPGGAFGAPAAVVMLARRGVPWDAAAVIAFGKSITGTAFLLLLAFAALAAGIGPAFGSGIRWTLAVGTGVVVVMLAVPMVAAFFPRRSLASIDRSERRLGGDGAPRLVRAVARGLRDTVERLALLRSGGFALVVKLAAANVAFYVAFLGVAVVLTMTLGGESWLRATGVSAVFLAFSYVAPTPGGAGLSEATAVIFYGSLLAPPEAVAVVLLSRALTFYLQVVVGAVYLPIAGGVGEILAYRDRQ